MKRTENFAQLFVTFLCNPVAIRKVTRYKGNVTACEPQQGSGEKWKRGHRFESTLPPLLPFFPPWKNRRRFYRVERRREKKKKEKRNFQYRDSPLTLITSDSFRVCFFTYSSFSLSLSNPTGPTLQIHSGFFSLVFRVFRGPLSSFSNFIAENFRQLSMLGNTILRWIYL